MQGSQVGIGSGSVADELTMASLAAERATTLKTAYRICNPNPLSGEDLERYYVDLSPVRKTSAIERVSQILEFQEPGESTTILFTGHRGCGKSTELKRIQKTWEQNYRVIYLEANEETDINDARYTDLYLITIKQVERSLRDLGLRLDQQLLRSFEDWFKEITEETEESVEKSVGIEAHASVGADAPFLAKLLVKLMAQIRGSNKQKKTIRQVLEEDIFRLKSDVNLLLADATRKLRQKYPHYKGFLLIIDNLDRISPEVGEHLFFDYGPQIQELNCSIIYTAPISVFCSTKNINNAFGDPHLMPMINIYRLDRDQRGDLDYDPQGLAAMVSLIESRVELDQVFASRDLVLELAKASGGHVRQLMQMMQFVCLDASAKGSTQILSEHVELGIKQQQFAFERLIPDDHYPLIADVYRTKDVKKDQQGQLMLFNVSVLEYNGNDRWNYPNPVVMRSDAFQEALRNQSSP